MSRQHVVPADWLCVWFLVGSRFVHASLQSQKFQRIISGCRNTRQASARDSPEIVVDVNRLLQQIPLRTVNYLLAKTVENVLAAVVTISLRGIIWLPPQYIAFPPHPCPPAPGAFPPQHIETCLLKCSVSCRCVRVHTLILAGRAPRARARVCLCVCV